LSGLVRDPVGLAIAASPVNWFYDARLVVSRLYTLLEPGGYLLLVAPLERAGGVSPLNPFIAALGGRRPPSREELEDMLLSEGFARVRVREGELLSSGRRGQALSVPRSTLSTRRHESLSVATASTTGASMLPKSSRTRSTLSFEMSRLLRATTRRSNRL